MVNDPPRSPTKPIREWSGQGKRRQCRVDTQYGDIWVVRGWIRPTGLADTTGPGLAGHTVWTLKTYDHVDLGSVTGDYLIAEKTLLYATQELEN